MEVTALMMGLAGSLHCLGMCSPLAMAVSNLTPGTVFNKLVYNIGRIFSYSLMGAAVAMAGFILPFEKYQMLISVILGTVMLLLGAAGIRNYHVPVVTPLLQKFSGFLKEVFSQQLKKRTYVSIATLGAINGFLPCGLTMIALTFCLSLAGPADGFKFMLLFGAGTLPVMLGFTTLFSKVLSRFQISFRALTSATMLLTGTLLIARVFLHGHAQHQSVAEIIMCAGK